ncbi:hypothetical protein EMGBD3_08820 [Nitrosarchaeum sp.]|nr:hypothetical protein EMGBD3_08820 [Nitrosarchaeum sp.]
MYLKILLVILFFTSISQFVFAEEPIPTTYSEETDKIIFDGKWTFTREWKESSLNEWRLNDGSGLILRTAHDGNYIYIFVDYLSDVFKDKGMDRATVCFGEPNHNKIANENDYCFLVTLGDNSPIVLQGGSPIAISGNFKKISDSNFVGVGAMSDNADRYTPVPHTSYEFKIPVELIGRNSEYSFYLSVYDFHRNVMNTWPRDIILENNFVIPSPLYWGTFYSPDKSLPEFHFLYFVFVVPFLMIIILRTQRYRKLVNFS